MRATQLKIMRSRNLPILYKKRLDLEVAVASSEIGAEVEKIKGGIIKKQSFKNFSYDMYGLGVLFGQVSTFLKDSTTFVYELGGL